MYKNNVGGSPVRRKGRLQRIIDSVFGWPGFLFRRTLWGPRLAAEELEAQARARMEQERKDRGSLPDATLSEEERLAALDDLRHHGSQRK